MVPVSATRRHPSHGWRCRVLAAGAAAASGCALAAPQAAILGDNAVISRPHGDSATGILFFDLNGPFVGAGEVASWSIFATNADGSVALLIYHGLGTRRSLVGMSPVETVTHTGVNSFTLPSPITVVAGACGRPHARPRDGGADASRDSPPAGGIGQRHLTGRRAPGPWTAGPAAVATPPCVPYLTPSPSAKFPGTPNHHQRRRARRDRSA